MFYWHQTFFLYAGCPIPAKKICPLALERLVKCLILASPRAQTLANMKCHFQGLVGVAEKELIAHTSIPPAFSLAAACARPDLIVLVLGIWNVVKKCEKAAEIEKAVQNAVNSQWSCELYGPFLPFIMHACYSIGTGFTDTSDVARCDLIAGRSTSGFIVAPRDKAMLVLLCGASRTIPVDTPKVIKEVWTLLQSYI